VSTSSQKETDMEEEFDMKDFHLRHTEVVQWYSANPVAPWLYPLIPCYTDLVDENE